MNISYDYYRIFYYVAKHGSFTQAANILLNNQPNITRAMKNLEAALGCTLFVRSNKGVTLTPEGEALYSHISLAFEHIQTGEEEIALNKGLQKGIVSIGASEIALRCFLLPILNEYRTKYPGIRIKIFNLTTPQALSAVKDGLADIAVVTTPVKVSDEVCKRNLNDLEEVLVCGETIHKQIGKQTLSLKDLTEYPLISLGNRTSTYALYSELFSQNGLVFSPDIEAATADQILPLVKHNLGIGFVPKEFLKNNFEAEGIYTVPLKESIPTRTICLITKKSKVLSLPAKELEQMIQG
ncbi:MAG: LysR family transcriptional regulator [Clostridia bacterium]|nr:LysR family transcriptional regulator [Clostridia bacterium]